jgi:hypothetical protein
MAMIKTRMLMSFVVCVVMIVFPFIVLSMEGKDRATRQLKTSDDAISSALAYTGFSKLV